jgi:hypothetical protein
VIHRREFDDFWARARHNENVFHNGATSCQQSDEPLARRTHDEVIGRVPSNRPLGGTLESPSLASPSASDGGQPPLASLSPAAHFLSPLPGLRGGTRPPYPVPTGMPSICRLVIGYDRVLASSGWKSPHSQTLVRCGVKSLVFLRCMSLAARPNALCR